MTDREFDAADTLLDIPDVRNFRDAGCGVLPAGLLFRSGSLSQLTEEGAQRLKSLGLRTVIDLRTASELRVWPDELHGLDVEQLNLPLHPDRSELEEPLPEDQLELYRFMAETGGAAIAGAVRALAAGTPVLVHCAVGKDRTGLTIAVIHHLAGLPEAELVDNFLRSNAALGMAEGPVPYVDEFGKQKLSRPVEASHLRAALARIRELHGSIVSFVSSHGVTPAELAALRALRTV